MQMHRQRIAQSKMAHCLRRSFLAPPNCAEFTALCIGDKRRPTAPFVSTGAETLAISRHSDVNKGLATIARRAAKRKKKRKKERRPRQAAVSVIFSVEHGAVSAYSSSASCARRQRRVCKQVATIKE